jgi:benzaldehyde dehydrogenase (NAD)
VAPSAPLPDRSCRATRVGRDARTGAGGLTAAAIVETNRTELENWLFGEGGAVPGKAAFEVGLVLSELWEAAALPTQPWGHPLPTSEAGRESIAQRLPVGVVGVISPWNFPQILSIRVVAPALALGNAVVLKPDVQTAVAGGVLSRSEKFGDDHA